MVTDIRKIIESFKDRKGAIIPALQAVQEAQGYISPESLVTIEDVLGISRNEAYGVATFYSQFRFSKPGEHEVKVCLGTACHVKGGAAIMDIIEDDLGVKAGGTTPDGKFTLERVACMGCCAVAPVIVVDDEIHGKMAPGTAKEIVDRTVSKGVSE